MTPAPMSPDTKNASQPIGIVICFMIGIGHLLAQFPPDMGDDGAAASGIEAEMQAAGARGEAGVQVEQPGFAVQILEPA